MLKKDGNVLEKSNIPLRFSYRKAYLGIALKSLQLPIKAFLERVSGIDCKTQGSMC